MYIVLQKSYYIHAGRSGCAVRGAEEKGAWRGGEAATQTLCASQASAKEARRVPRPALHGRCSAGSRDGLVRREARAELGDGVLLGKGALSSRACAAHQQARALATAQLGRRLGDFRWHVRVCVCAARVL